MSLSSPHIVWRHSHNVKQHVTVAIYVTFAQCVIVVGAMCIVQTVTVHFYFDT